MIIITVAKKPSTRSITDNVLDNGCGAVNIDQTRISCATTGKRKTTKRTNRGEDGVFKDTNSGMKNQVNRFADADPKGRWPANLFLSSVAVGGFPYTETHAGTYRKDSDYSGTSYTILRNKGDVASNGNSGSASRYFKVFK